MNTPQDAVCDTLAATIAPVKHVPQLDGQWQGQAWADVPALCLDCFHAQSLSRHPRTQVKVAYDADHVYLHFRVEDQHVQSLYTNYQDNVCRDSCVEFFVEPVPGKGYFNFEINCGGAMLLFYISDATRNIMGGFKKYVRVPFDVARHVRIYHSMPRTTPSTLHQPTTWQIEMAIPFSVFRHYLPEFEPTPGSTWRANFFKCGGDLQYQHWASWASQGRELNFHQPEYFGQLTLG